MTQFMAMADRLKELGATVVLVTASVWFAFKYLPVQMKKQGEVEEILRNNTALIESCTEVLRVAASKDASANEVLHRCESKLEEILLHQNNIAQELRDMRRR